MGDSDHGVVDLHARSKMDESLGRSIRCAVEVWEKTKSDSGRSLLTSEDKWGMLRELIEEHGLPVE